MRRYQVMEAIGAGGMGTVYQALDRLTGDIVALKRVERVHNVTINAATEAAFLQNLAHEFSVLAGLRHPNIITVLDYGFEADRRPYFTMELLQNPQTIVQAAQAVSFSARMGLLMQLLQALAYLHRRGILHRDLKPANVLVADNTVRLLDFGLASPSHSSGEFAGTVAYMPPEMLRDQHYFPASDLYAVGVLAVEMFTGHLPFPERDVLAVLNNPPDLSGLPDEHIRTLLMQLLHKEPTARLTDIEAILASLSEISGIPIAEQPAIRESYLQAAPFIGREAQLVQLTDALNATISGQGGAVLIGGESGVGKSRLINELRIHALTAGVVVLRGQAVQSGGLPYHLLRDPLAYLAVTNTLTELEAGVLQAVLPERSRFFDQTAAPIQPLQGEAEQQRLTYILVNLLRRLESPILLLLEDLQWAAESFAVLQRLCSLAHTLPLLIVGTFRNDEAPTLPNRLPEMSLITLERLSRQETEQLCTAMMGSVGENPALIDRLQQESDGNVFFLIETLRVLAEQAGRLTEVGTTPLPSVLFPQGITEVIQKRLSYLPDWTHSLLKLAAIAGRHIEPELLVQAVESPIELERWLYTCMNAAVLEIRDNQWRFSHDKLRELLIHSLPTAEQAQLHLWIAQTLETLYPDDVAQAKRLVDHWQGAGNLDKTLHYLLIAAQNLYQVGAMLELRAMCERGLALLHPITDERLHTQLLCWLAAACRENDVDLAQTTCQQAITIAERNGWDDLRFDAVMTLGRVFILKNDFGAAENLLNHTLEEVRARSDSFQEMHCLSAIVSLLGTRGDYRNLQLPLEQFLALAQQYNLPDRIASGLLDLSVLQFVNGRFNEGMNYAQQAETIAQSIGARRIVARSLIIQWNGLIRSNYAAAMANFERITTLLQTMGEFSQLAEIYRDCGTFASRQGQLDEAWMWYQKARALIERINNPHQLLYCLHGLGYVDYKRRNYSTARDFILGSLQLAQQAHYPDAIVMNESTLVRISLMLGELDAARRALKNGLLVAQQLDPLYSHEMLYSAIDYALFEERSHEAAAWFGLAKYSPMHNTRNPQEIEAYRAMLQDQLDPDELAAAIEFGKTLDLQTTVANLLKELEMPE